MGVVSFTQARDRLLAADERDLSSSEVCVEIAEAVQLVAPYDAAAVMNTDPETNLPAGGVVVGFDASQCEPFWDNELMDPDFLKFNDLARSVDPIGTLFEVTDGELDRSPRFTKLYRAFGAVDELRVAFASGTTCLGIGSFVRCQGAPFTPTEVADVRNLLMISTTAMRRALGRIFETGGGGGPIVLLLDADNAIVSMSADAEERLDDIRVNEIDELLPGTVMVAVSKLRRSRSTDRLSTRLRGHSGRWYRVHASAMDDEAGSVVVTIESAAPGDLVPILLDSYGLTARETDIVLALCRGRTTKEMAADLAISVHTVRDHMKAIFDKAEVNSRGELVARLFSDHVIRPMEAAVSHLR